MPAPWESLPQGRTVFQEGQPPARSRCCTTATIPSHRPGRTPLTRSTEFGNRDAFVFAVAPGVAPELPAEVVHHGPHLRSAIPSSGSGCIAAGLGPETPSQIAAGLHTGQQPWHETAIPPQAT